MQKKSGFTLIELSIVLVIIGLITGGVLVGRDLIKTAQIRKTVSQIESINTTANAFRLKYNCIPTDCGKDEELGLPDMAGLGYHKDVATNGNAPYAVADNGKIDMIESWMFFEYLATTIGFAPTAKDNNGFLISPVSFSANGYSNGDGFIECAKAYWNVAWINSVPNGTVEGNAHYIYTKSELVPWCGANILPMEAFMIDSKLDDGKPRSGTVRASGSDVVNDENLPPFLSVFDAATEAASPAGSNNDFCITNQLEYNTQNSKPSRNKKWHWFAMYVGG